MNVFGLLFLLLTHFLSGYGFLALFKLQLKPVEKTAVSMITGIVLFSFIPFVLQLFYIPITLVSVMISILLLTVVLNIKSFNEKNASPINLKTFLRSITWPKLYELPFLLFYGFLVITSVWICFYFPLAARDMLSGPEAIAEYTVREKTMINSVFSINLESTNNHLKPPFVTSLQIIYKLIVCPFGALWLSVLFISFTTWLYSILKEKLHPILAGLFLLLFLAIPELFGYTHIVLFDYSNMVFFFSGFYFLSKYIADRQTGQFLFASVLFAFATYMRLETIVLLVMMLPLLLYIFYQEKLSPGKILFRSAFFLLLPAFIYFMWVNVYVKYYMPVHFDMGEHLNTKFSDLNIFFTRLKEMNSEVLFSEYGEHIYGYFIYVFGLLFIADILFYRRFNNEMKLMLYGIALVYFGMPLLGWLMPWFDLMNTTKRGLFKMFPLMLLYMRNSGLLLKISERITNWEFAMPAASLATGNTVSPKAVAAEVKNKTANTANASKKKK